MRGVLLNFVSLLFGPPLMTPPPPFDSSRRDEFVGGPRAAVAVAVRQSEKIESLGKMEGRDLALKNNGSLYAHVFFARSGYPPDPNDPEYQPQDAFGRTHSLVAYLPKSRSDKTKSLLGNSKDAEESEPVAMVADVAEAESKDDGPVEWIAYWKPNITINLVEDLTRYGHNATKYITLYPYIDQSFQIHRSYGSMLEGEADELKQPTAVGNSEPFNKFQQPDVDVVDNFQPSSTFQQPIVANLQPHSDFQQTNVNSETHGRYEFIQALWWISHINLGHSCKNGKEKKDQFLDASVLKYLFYVLFLLVACFSIYSLMYERHKSWYSWILSSLTSYVYIIIFSISSNSLFQITTMCPQLFINYKLKFVVHLPWRQMTYKFLNTITDDLFAFVIKMPTLHRLSVFRDDLIFLIYLYQKWVYPVDKKRINEFGFGGEDDQAPGSTNITTANEDEKKTN
ncbi:hypothetical protein GQ457_05G016340 [Hibiscus cannabinus]